MACACQNKTGPNGQATPSSYTLTRPDGIQKSYTTMIEAEAAKARAGGGTITPS